MNIVFWIIVFGAAILFWIYMSYAFKSIGIKVDELLKTVKSNIKNEEE